MSYFCHCPRCGERTLERLESYSHCVQCLYVEDYWESPDRGYIEAEKILREHDNSPIEEKDAPESNVIELPTRPEFEPIGA